MTLHSEEMPFVCEVCGAAFRASYTLTVHRRRHTRERPYDCELCNETFIRSDHLKKHMHVVHINPQKTPLHSARGQLADKRDKKAKKEQQPPVLLECPECGERMVRADLLRHRCANEQQVTAPEHRPFVCDTCKKAFKTVAHLQRHNMLHTDDKPFACTVCDRTFRARYSLQVHERAAHSGERPYACTLCTRRFARTDHLNHHVRAIHLCPRTVVDDVISTETDKAVTALNAADKGAPKIVLASKLINTQTRTRMKHKKSPTTANHVINF